MDNEMIMEKIKTICANTNVCFLLGAGTSVIKASDSTSFPLMTDLLEEVKKDATVDAFYKSSCDRSASNQDQFGIVKSIFDRYLYSSQANVEWFLSVLDGMDLYIAENTFRQQVLHCRDAVKNCIRKRIMDSDTEVVLPAYKLFFQALQHLKEVSSTAEQARNVFSTNYDMLCEQAMEEMGIHYYAGFYGIAKRQFNTSFYDHEFVNTHHIKRGEYVTDRNHINLYKLHGSLSWYYDASENELFEKNPYDKEFSPEIIYPSSTKFQRTNSIVYYSALMREFSDKICQENTTLAVVGTSLKDDHLNKLIDNALAIPDFTLLLFAFDMDQLKEFQEQYKKYVNVIVCPETKTFTTMAEMFLQIEAAK